MSVWEENKYLCGTAGLLLKAVVTDAKMSVESMSVKSAEPSKAINLHAHLCSYVFVLVISSHSYASKLAAPWFRVHSSRVQTY